MDGSVFYWICWMAWVCSTFFMKKNRERLILSGCFLLLIIVSPYFFVIGSVRINIGIFIVLLYCFTKIAKRTSKQKLYLLICILTISLAYSSFQLFELYDPVWLFFNRNFMLAAALIYVTIMLVKEFQFRLVALLIGAIQGDILYAIIVSNVNIPYDIGSFKFLDVISISGGFIFVWSSLELLFNHFDVLFQKNTKEKHG
ncbi:hypothetical protein [Fredinandcohnia sp. 179-A 10B2 NHS]|uniref:YphA family membrane protein n=1 Tax=Fredinandcohnia sp. 179-A 10B2 NHS TaxID=3235176 RepID=UPI0039A26C23